MKITREFTRLIIDARRTAGLTQEAAAELLNVAISTLQRYEQDIVNVNPQIVERMALVYRDPRLSRLYCEHECPIGCTGQHCGCDKPPEAIMLDLLLLDPSETQSVVQTLRTIMADGVIDDTEQEDCDRCMAFLDGLERNAAALKLQVQRACAQRR